MPREHLAVAFRLALAHHPLCHHFRSDRFGPFCSGCALFAPAFAAGTLVAVDAVLAGADPAGLFLAGAVLGIPQLRGMRRRMGRAARGAIKVLGGAGVGAANVGLLMLPVPWWLKLALLGLEITAFGMLLAIRMRSILAVCHACPWQRDWEHCPGFVRGAPADPPGRRGAPTKQADRPGEPLSLAT